MKSRMRTERHRAIGPRQVAQGLYFLSGLYAALMFGGVDLWAKGSIALFLAAACLLESTVADESPSRISRGVLVCLGLLLSWISLTLCPWPASWAGFLAPGQASLLSELEWKFTHSLHGSMAPCATWSVLFGVSAVTVSVYLVWHWSEDRFFRAMLNYFLLVLATGVVVDWEV